MRRALALLAVVGVAVLLAPHPWTGDSGKPEASLPEAIDALEKGLALEAKGAARNMAKTHQIWGGHHTLHAIGAVVEGATPSARRHGRTPMPAAASASACARGAAAGSR